MAVLSHVLDLCPKWLPRQHADLAGLDISPLSLSVSLWQGTASCRPGKVRAALFSLVQLQVLPCFSLLIVFNRDPAFMPMKIRGGLSKKPGYLVLGVVHVCVCIKASLCCLQLKVMQFIAPISILLFPYRWVYSLLTSNGGTSLL